MTTAPNLIRAFLAAAVCMVAFAVCAPASFGQVVSEPPAAGSEIGAPVDPPVVPDPPVEEPPVNNPPADPAPTPEPPPDPPVVPEPTPDPPIVLQEPDQQKREETALRPEPSREPAEVVVQAPSTMTATPSVVPPTPAPLPTASAGENFTWTEKGDAFIFETGGSDGGNPTAVLASLSRFGSIASAAVGIPALDAHERAAREAAQANIGGSGLVLVDSTGNGMLFFNLFGGGGGGGAALVMLTVLGIVTLYRLMPPDGTRTFRNSTAVWRPSAYDPPIEHPG